jgi:hypothetical protein
MGESLANADASLNFDCTLSNEVRTVDKHGASHS